MTGTLYLCATPIGNLNDITFRVLDTLREVDIIAAEDTRNSIKLLNHFEIKTPMTSYHEHNKVEKALQIISWLKAGKNIALITDAGTPAISDPGEVLVEKCLKEGIPVTSLPGCCALITALTLSGISARRFCFEGFLPGEKKERRFVLDELGRETRTIILYEAPHHLKRTLGELYDVLGERRITLCRELTKRFETVFPTSIEQAVAYYEKEEPRGEYVLVIEGLDRNKLKLDEQTKWEEISIREHMRIYEDKGIDRKEAMKKVAADRGISKREVYQSLLC
ncbi:16S rRNA (cytidine(1402)-2'-O)-methyltransferase [Parablautia intestinalis]|uniref:Ribosomal RNA small subunit methyltransferase I n=1 Tax=Parablautia intestinalis TaxID=2320100 RepID=A0A3A9A7U3_9FIRM|nr:16S rRNA (cytidine(1402)-2'-O)-methyltransferase [Parablautia intestinalis]RKI87467.1 16S rRNA (cytidine(1402)-2'-O)-methyltransferase [Parablautia intestinalis]